MGLQEYTTEELKKEIESRENQTALITEGDARRLVAYVDHTWKGYRTEDDSATERLRRAFNMPYPVYAYPGSRMW